MNIKKLGARLFNVIIFLFGAITGNFIFNGLYKYQFISSNNGQIISILKYSIILIFGIIFFLFSNNIKSVIASIISSVEEELLKRPMGELVVGTIGLIVGLIIAFFFGQLVNSFEFGIIGSLLSLAIYIIFPYLGLSIMSNKSSQILSLFDKKLETDTKKQEYSKIKVVDTSVIIDGRIEEIVRTGFIKGDILLPIFVLEELQHIADDSNTLKRNRGRRGLDVVNKLKESHNINLKMTDIDFEDISEVDSKLVKLALEMDADILTTDYNLNKVASVQGIQVLNINELANSLKPIAIPGENMTVEIIKKGQEENQGLAYLDDGTMIVIDQGLDHIGHQVEVTVSSVLQTNAGKMIFADYRKRIK